MAKGGWELRWVVVFGVASVTCSKTRLQADATEAPEGSGGSPGRTSAGSGGSGGVQSSGGSPSQGRGGSAASGGSGGGHASGGSGTGGEDSAGGEGGIGEGGEPSMAGSGGDVVDSWLPCDDTRPIVRPLDGSSCGDTADCEPRLRRFEIKWEHGDGSQEFEPRSGNYYYDDEPLVACMRYDSGYVEHYEYDDQGRLSLVYGCGDYCSRGWSRNRPRDTYSYTEDGSLYEVMYSFDDEWGTDLTFRYEDGMVVHREEAAYDTDPPITEDYTYEYYYTDDNLLDRLVTTTVDHDDPNVDFTYTEESSYLYDPQRNLALTLRDDGLNYDGVFAAALIENTLTSTDDVLNQGQPVPVYLFYAGDDGSLNWNFAGVADGQSPLVITPERFSDCDLDLDGQGGADYHVRFTFDGDGQWQRVRYDFDDGRWLQIEASRCSNRLIETTTESNSDVTITRTFYYGCANGGVPDPNCFAACPSP